MLKPIGDFLHIIRTINFQVGRSSISLTEVVQLIFFVIITFFLANYLSNFLKHRGLSKVILDKGSRYFISNFISYGIGFFLLLIILQSTGFDVSILAVFGGGLGIGIGFGFQDFARNFVSGLTLLTERKIKTGDYIQLGELRGFVQEVSTRTIVIRKKDGSSVIVPNSQFVEQQVINFHYEATRSRLTLPISVADDSDTTLVTETLLLAAYSECSILQNPSPQVIFRGFEQNGLLFELWVWVDNTQLGFQDEIVSSLYFILEYQCRLNKISIPFPQHDIWIRNIRDFPLWRSRSRVGDNVVDLQGDSAGYKASHQALQQHNSDLKVTGYEPRISIRSALKKVGSFSHLSELRLRQIIEIGALRSLKQDEVLFRENDPGDAFYIVLSGKVEVYAEGLEKQLAVLTPGHFFGEMSLMLGIPRTATIRALESTLLFAIVHSKFKVLLQRYPDFQEAIAEELSNHQEELLLRKQELQAKGLLTEEEQETNIVTWVQQRLQTIFSL